jgi:hypothetical protein
VVNALYEQAMGQGVQLSMPQGATWQQGVAAARPPSADAAALAAQLEAARQEAAAAAAQASAARSRSALLDKAWATALEVGAPPASSSCCAQLDHPVSISRPSPQPPAHIPRSAPASSLQSP